MTATTRLPVGCYTTKVTASVTDNDGGTGVSPEKTVLSTDVYAAAFKEPIKDSERNIAKYGNVVPIKVQLNSMVLGPDDHAPVPVHHHREAGTSRTTRRTPRR